MPDFFGRPSRAGSDQPRGPKSVQNGSLTLLDTQFGCMRAVAGPTVRSRLRERLILSQMFMKFQVFVLKNQEISVMLCRILTTDVDHINCVRLWGGRLELKDDEEYCAVIPSKSRLSCRRPVCVWTLGALVVGSFCLFCR